MSGVVLEDFYKIVYDFFWNLMEINLRHNIPTQTVKPPPQDKSFQKNQKRSKFEGDCLVFLFIDGLNQKIIKYHLRRRGPYVDVDSSVPQLCPNRFFEHQFSSSLLKQSPQRLHVNRNSLVQVSKKKCLKSYHLVTEVEKYNLDKKKRQTFDKKASFILGSWFFSNDTFVHNNLPIITSSSK